MIPKPNKPDYTNPKAYRPIALLNCLGKVLEKIIATRLSHLAETHHLLNTHQHGGRPKRNAIDAVAALVNLIEINKKGGLVTSALFLDVKGAFDNVSSSRLLRTLRNLLLPPPLLSWVTSFLSSRQTALAFNSKTEPMQPVTTGIPQGSPTSPILFLLYLHPLFQHLNATFPQAYLPSYVDDVAIVVTSKHETINANLLTLIATEILRWSTHNHLSFDGPKTELMHFQIRRIPIEPTHLEVTLPDGNTIKPALELRWLGMILDPGLTFTHHIRRKCADTTQAFHALRRLCNTQHGLTLTAIHRLYKTVLLPKLDYGAPIWWKGQSLTTLSHLQNQALRLTLEALRTTPIAVLELEAAIPPTPIRLNHLQRSYALRTHQLPTTHPLRQIGSPNGTPTPNTLQDRLSRHLQQLPPLEPTNVAPPPPWYTPPHIDFQTPQHSKGDTTNLHNHLIRSLCQQPINDTTIVYTDGSRLNDGRTGCGAYDLRRNKTILQVHLGTSQEVFDAELTAISHTLNYFAHTSTIGTCNIKDLWIFVDNAAAITRLQHLRPGAGQQHALQSHRAIQQLTTLGTRIHIHWVPGHCDIFGNEKVDKIAKAGAHAHLPPTPHSTSRLTPGTMTWLRRKLKRQTLLEWKWHWKTLDPKKKGQQYTRLKPPTTKLDPSYTALARPLSSVLIQLRTGHGPFRQYLHRIKQIDNGSCFCNRHHHQPPPQTAQHLILECPTFKTPRAELKRLLAPTPLTPATLYTIKGTKHILAFIAATRIGLRGWENDGTINPRERAEEERWWGIRHGDGDLADDHTEE